MKLIDHAKREFEILGWPGDDEMQELVCSHVLELLETFANQGHSGFSANYVLRLFDALARFKPIAPLTGDDDEWIEVKKGLYQNKRCSSVFKENGIAYWAEGIVFRYPNGATYVNKNSRVAITFPWQMPSKPEIRDVDEL